MKKIGTVAAASIGAFAVGATVAGGIAIASADANSATDSPSNSQQGWGRGPMGGERGPGQLVTGEDAQKSIAAALTAVRAPRTTCTRRPDGTYRVMVTTAEGKHVVVTLDASFAVTGQQEMQGRDPATAEAPQPPSRRRSRPPTLLWRGFRRNRTQRLQDR